MAASELIRTRLLAVSGVTSITSAIYVGDTPQTATAPRIEIHELGTDPLATLDSTGGNDGLRNITIDIDCKAATSHVNSHTLADAVEAALNDHSGSNLKAFILEDRSDSTETPNTGQGKAALYVTTLDYTVQYTA